MQGQGQGKGARPARAKERTAGCAFRRHLCPFRPTTRLDFELTPPRTPFIRISIRATPSRRSSLLPWRTLRWPLLMLPLQKKERKRNPHNLHLHLQMQHQEKNLRLLHEPQQRPRPLRNLLQRRRTSRLKVVVVVVSTVLFHRQPSCSGLSRTTAR